MNPRLPLTIALSFIAVLGHNHLAAQTNTFPSSGNVGIGTSAPDHTLDLLRENGTVAIRFHVPGVSWYTMGIDSSDNYKFKINESGWFAAGQNRLTLDRNGHVGIGTTTPWDKLTVSGSITADGGVLKSSIYSNEGGRLTLANPQKYGATTAEWSLYNMTSGYGNGLAFWRYYADGTNPGPSVFFHDNGNVGIGTNGPSQRLEVIGSVLVATSSTEGSLFLGNPNHGLRRPAGTNNVELYTTSGNVFILGGNVGIGTTSPQHKLAVNGTIKAKEVIVETTGWSDYVFADNYRVTPLAEVEAHIKTNKHLPGIPSAAQVAEQGVSVGDMQARLLAKVEELTLHLIAQQKTLETLQSQNASFKAQNAALQARLQRLETP